MYRVRLLCKHTHFDCDHLPQIHKILSNAFSKIFYFLAFSERDNHIIIIKIIIISLFQKDNIFGTNASLTYGPRLQR